MSLADKVATSTPDTGAAPPAEAATTEATGTTTTTESTASTDWYYDDHLKGEGNRPEWLKSKYKSTSDQAKAYTDLEKKLGAFTGAPEKYDLSMPNNPDIKFADNDPLLTDFLASAKKNGVSQEYVSELLETYAHVLTASAPNLDAELAKLGADAANEITSLVNWGNSQFSKDEMATLKSMMTTAESVRLFEKMRNLATSSDIAPPSGRTEALESIEQVTELVGDPRYKTNPAFRAEVKQRLTVAMSRQKKG